jgi:hypothetical protein
MLSIVSRDMFSLFVIFFSFWLNNVGFVLFFKISVQSICISYSTVHVSSLCHICKGLFCTFRSLLLYFIYEWVQQSFVRNSVSACFIKHVYHNMLWTKDCCTHTLLHAQQDALTQYKVLHIYLYSRTSEPKWYHRTFVVSLADEKLSAFNKASRVKPLGTLILRLNKLLPSYGQHRASLYHDYISK